MLAIGDLFAEDEKNRGPFYSTYINIRNVQTAKRKSTDYSGCKTNYNKLQGNGRLCKKKCSMKMHDCDKLGLPLTTFLEALGSLLMPDILHGN